MAKKRHGKSGRPTPAGASRAAAVAPSVTASRGPRARPRTDAVGVASASKKAMSGRLIVGAIALFVVVLLLGGAAVALLWPRLSPVTGVFGVVTNAAEGDLLGVPIPDEGRVHVPEGSAINYRHNPPASGPHYPSPKDWGIYTATVADGYWVHNLEHGGIVVLYDCPAGCSQVVAELQQADRTFPKDKYNEVKLLATPYSGLPNGVQVMAVAWDFQKAYSSFDLQKLQVFYNGHVDHGPEDIP
ncbi:MAG: DUF3105 domain-containing protein [Chloroflexota bacterium]